MTAFQSTDSSNLFGLLLDLNFPDFDFFITALQDPNYSKDSKVISFPSSLPPSKWTLTTKYYTTKLENYVLELQKQTFFNDAVLQSCKAICILLSVNHEISDALVQFLETHPADSKLVVFPTTPSKNLSHIDPTLAEIVILDKLPENYDPLEKTGISRVREVLETTPWSNIMKTTGKETGTSNLSSPSFPLDSFMTSIQTMLSPNEKSNILDEDNEELSLSEQFLSLREYAQDLQDISRRDFAEEVIMGLLYVLNENE